MIGNRLSICVSALTLITTVGATPLSAQSLDGWDWSWEIYGWLPDIEATTQGGADLELPIDDILDNLDFTFQTSLSASRGNWTLFGDLVYLDLGASDTIGTSRPIGSFGRVDIEVDALVDMKSIISTYGAGYKFYDDAKTKLSAVGGLRYTYMDVTVDADVEGNAEIDLLGQTFKRQFKDQLDVESDEHFWDGVIGLQGTTQLNDNWNLLYYADVGTGDSDLTWQASVGVAYAFENFDVTLRYRYIDYEFDSDAPLDSMNVGGPQIGIRFQF
jgi:hypothetical protein